MTYDEMILEQNDPRRSPMGPWGPRGGQRAYRITAAPRAASRPAPTRRPSSADRDAEERFRERLERHRKEAEVDRVRRRLRALK